jgi:signal transduction histidine kinase
MVYTQFRGYVFYLYKNYLDQITVEYSQKIVSDNAHFLQLYFDDLPEDNYYCLRGAMECYLKSVYSGIRIPVNKYYTFSEKHVEKFSLRVANIKNTLIKYLLYYTTDVCKLSEVVREMEHFYAIQEGVILKEFVLLRKQEIETLKKVIVPQTTPSKTTDNSLMNATLQRSFMDLKEEDTHLKKAYSELDDFINKVYVELKAPVSNIEGLIKEMMEEVSGDKEDAEAIRQMLNASLDRIKKTIQLLLEISELYNTDVLEQKKFVSLPEALDDVLEELLPCLLDVKLNVVREFEIETIYFSEKHLKSVLFHLLLNAVKFRRPGNTVCIVIKAVIKNDRMVVSFCDNGIGINPKDHHRIFQPFQKAQNIDEGLGSGLFLVKSIMEKHQGKIDVQSEPGWGTIFNLFF